MVTNSSRLKDPADSRRSPIPMCENDLGYSVIDTEALTDLASNLVTEHIALRLGRQFSNPKVASESAIETSFEKFRDKTARILHQKAVNEFLGSLEGVFKFSKAKESVLNNSSNPVFMRVSKHFMVSIIASF